MITSLESKLPQMLRGREVCFQFRSKWEIPSVRTCSAGVAPEGVRNSLMRSLGSPPDPSLFSGPTVASWWGIAGAKSINDISVFVEKTYIIGGSRLK